MRKGNGVRQWEKEPEERRDEDVMLQRTGSGTKEMDSSPEPLEGRQPCQHFDFRASAPQKCEQIFCVYVSH